MLRSHAASDRAIAGETSPIVWWGATGAGFALLQAVIFARWMASPQFVATPPGDTPLPIHANYIIQFFQATFPLCIAAGLAWFIWQWRRDGRAPAYGLLMVGWASVYWQDPLINYVRPAFSYNSHFFNRGSWCEFVPGWLSPNGSRMPEPLLFGVGAYAFFIPISALICMGFMRLAKHLYPPIGTPGLLLVALASMFGLDLIVEGLLVLSQMYAYVGSIHALSLFPGTLYQFPLYESVLGGLCAAASGALFYFRDDKGQMMVERGLESVGLKRGRQLLRMLAVSGFLNVVLLAYTAAYIVLNLHMDAWPAGMPSYLLNGVCGAGTSYECPGPDVHIPLRSSGPLAPFTGRN